MRRARAAYGVERGGRGLEGVLYLQRVVRGAALHDIAASASREEPSGPRALRNVEPTNPVYTSPGDPYTPQFGRQARQRIFWLGNAARRGAPQQSLQRQRATVAAAKNTPALIATQFVQRSVLRRVASEPRTRAARVAEASVRRASGSSAIPADDRRTSRGTQAPRGAGLMTRSRPSKPRQKRRSSRPIGGGTALGSRAEDRLFAGGIDPPAILLAHRRPTRTPASGPKKKADPAAPC